ncbi:MAG: arginase family protein [Actinomycetota bacterium]
MTSSRTTIFGVPIDCVGEPVGTTRTPGVLRSNGVVERLGARDLGDLDVMLGPAVRDPDTGIVGSDSVLDLTRTIRAATADALDAEGTLVILGGCCTLAVGAMAGVRDRFPDAGLVYLDGHLDLYDGRTSPGGEAADMPLAVALGVGPQAWVDAVGGTAIVSPSDVALLGFRDLEEAASHGSVTPADLPGMTAIDGPAVHARGARAVAEDAIEAVGHGRRFFVFIDADVLDPSELVVDAPVPNGLRWEQLTELAGKLVGDPACLGIALACYNPDLDADGSGATRVVSFLRDVVPAGARAS